MCIQPSHEGSSEKIPAKKYVTIPGSGGKRKWIRILPPQVRGKDKKPRKRGEEHGNWKHGFGKSRPYDTEKYRGWKEAVLINDDFCCFVTGEKEELACHHLGSWDWFIEGRYDPLNGITLKKEIHEKFHKMYGSGQNTVEQFEDFLKKEYNMCLPNDRKGNHDPSFTTEKLFEKIKTKDEEKQEQLIQLVDSRNHELVSGENKNCRSVIVVKCKIHDTIHTTTVTNYKKSRTGMPCCGAARQGEITAYHNRLRSKKNSS